MEFQLNNLHALLSKPHHEEPHDTIGINEVAKILHLSVDTIYTKTHKRIIPHRKQGKKLLFSRRAIEDYLNEGEVKTIHAEFLESEIMVSKKLSKRPNVC